ncbi:MAG TPA: type II toxin-antitoxin system Phd/YefM family antitoxin [Thermomicrobiales bacterium]|nr:type II toxin-antitoxin system Phd/YefM family antitoxin [Thermomicrobiales bacterium]
MIWPASEARRHFGALVQRALDEGPQIVTRRGEEVVVVLAAAEYRRLAGRRRDFTDFLLNGPDLGRLDLRRAKDRARVVDL